MPKGWQVVLRRRPVLAVVVLVMCVTPPLFLLALSNADAWRFPTFIPGQWQPQRWLDVLGGSSRLSGSFGLSVLISITVAGCCTPMGYLIAKAIAFHPRKRLWLFLAYLPFAMSPVILATCLMFLYLKLGLNGTVSGVILAQAMFALGFSIVFFGPFWNRERQALEQLVLTLGGTPWQALRHALLPVSRGMLLICFFQTFLISWFQYGLTLLIGAGKIQTLPIKVYEYVNEANPYYAALASCLLVIPPIVLLWLNKRFVFNRL